PGIERRTDDVGFAGLSVSPRRYLLGGLLRRLHTAPLMRRLVILGSTGSVRTNALDVVTKLPDRFRVGGLAAGSSAERLAEQARTHRVDAVALEDPAAGRRAETALHGTGARVHKGPGAALELLRGVEADVVLQATVGAAALTTTFAAIEKGCLVALANKE